MVLESIDRIQYMYNHCAIGRENNLEKWSNATRILDNNNKKQKE